MTCWSLAWQRAAASATVAEVTCWNGAVAVAAAAVAAAAAAVPRKQAVVVAATLTKSRLELPGKRSSRTPT